MSHIFRGPRPQDFFGPEDWDGGEVEAMERDVALRQKIWDHGWSLLTWWQRQKYHMSFFKEVRVDFRMETAGLPESYGIYQDEVRLVGPDY